MACSTSLPQYCCTGTDDCLIYLKVHDTENGKIVAMCDEALIDKVLEEGTIVIDIKGYSDFYRGKLVSPDESNGIPEKSKIFSANIVGKESVKAAIDWMVIEKGHVKTVKGVPYAQAYRV